MDRHGKTKLFLEIAGSVLLVAGMVFIIIGFVDFFSSIGKGMPAKAWCLFVGFPLAAFGGVFFLFGRHAEISRYIQKENAPVINEFMQDIKPAVTEAASSVKEGFAEQELVCECGETNGASSKFCRACGKPLTKTCADCGTVLPATAKFCDSCGKKQ